MKTQDLRKLVRGELDALELSVRAFCRERLGDERLQVALSQWLRGGRSIRSDLLATVLAQLGFEVVKK